MTSVTHRAAARSRRPSVRALSVAAVAAIAAATIGLMVVHLWVVARLDREVAAVVVATRCVGDINQIARDVHAFHRLGNLLVAEPSSELAGERAQVERRLTAEVRDTAARMTDPVESRIANEARRRVIEYLRYRHQLEAELDDVGAIASRGRRSFEAALGSLDSWRAIEEQRVEMARHASHRLRRAAALVAGGGALLLVAAMVGAGIGLRAYALRPIVAMRDTIERLRAGDPNARAPEIGARETAEVAGALNDLIGELRRRRETQLAFLAGVAHDL
ncbi:MAG TPA: hypothetical protein VKZ63_19930, partial [Kofleriaceae bacterium]|nr:hypothetical protein [Kofleriaceae bacterium]